jgi:hypothetical protein
MRSPVAIGAFQEVDEDGQLLLEQLSASIEVETEHFEFVSNVPWDYRQLHPAAADHVEYSGILARV